MAARPPSAGTPEGSDALHECLDSAVAIAGLVVYLAYRYMGLRVWHAIVALIFGFLLAATSAAPEIRNLHRRPHSVAPEAVNTPTAKGRDA